MSDPASDRTTVPEGDAGNALYKKDFWSEENLKYSRPHFRMEKASRLINRLAAAESVPSSMSAAGRLP